MIKALFLILTYSLPVIFIFPPDEHVSYIWGLIYAPIAIFYPIFIFRKPNEIMFKLITYTPLIYFCTALPISLILNEFMGVLAASFLTVIILLLLGLVVGYVYLAIVYCLYLSFKKLGFMAADS